jgi:hypothetical protein
LSGLLIKPVVFVTELNGFEQASLSPVIDVSAMTSQPRGDFLNCQPSLLTQTLAPAFEFMGAPQLVDDPQVEQATGA